MVLVPIVLVTRSVHKFRAGLIGLIAPATVLVMDTANTYLEAKNYAPGKSRVE